MPVLNNIFKAMALFIPPENIVELNTLNTRKNCHVIFHNVEVHNDNL
jgi:hypothetical protein